MIAPDTLWQARWSERSLTRRRFLQVLGLSAAAYPVIGCRGAEGPPGDAAPAPDAPPFSVWREIRDAVRTSPDHLAARAARLVEARDPEAIFAFVRDQIATYPTRPDGFGTRSGDVVGAMRWGIHGTLRCGAGTPREKAELLAKLYRDAGFDAEVVAGQLDPAVDVRRMFFRRIERVFAPEVTQDRIQSWARAMDARQSAPRPVLDENAGESTALADNILAQLPPDAAAPSFDFSLTRVPIVRVTVGAAERYANPLVPDAALGDARADRIARAPRAHALRPLEVAVQVANTDDPTRRVTVAEATWPLEDVVGRRIVLQFVPVGDLRAALEVPATRIRAFTPVLALDDVHAPRDALIERAVVGSVVTVGGDVIAVDDRGRLQLNGDVVATDAPAPSSVAALDAEAWASGFPVVRLRVAARDSAGAPVLGLQADAFSIRENGVAVPFLVRESVPPPPKLLLLFDLSRSLPADFRGAGAGAVARRVAEGVLAQHPDAAFQVASVTLGSATGERRWMQDPAQVETAARRLTSWGSAFWSALGSARRIGANVVVLITDGQSTDTPEQLATAREHVASGPPVICVAVGDVRRQALDEIAALTGGAVFEVQNQQQTVDAITRQLAGRAERPIIIEYEAPREGPSERTVEVRAGSATGTARYTVPAPNDRLPTPALAGIYLVIRSDGREVIRTLAGVMPERVNSRTSVDQATRDDVRAALLGATLLSVEAGAPTLSAWLDDMLTARLTWAPLWEAAQRNEPDSLARAIEAGVRVVPSHTLLLHPPLEQSDNALTFETGPRFVLLHERPIYTGGVLRTADVLPSSGWATAAADPREAFRLTTRRTARLAVTETTLYADSTGTRLAGRPVQYVPPIGTADRRSTAAEWVKVLSSFSGRHRLVPADEGPFAFWAVDRSGSLLGVLPDGSGGGISKDANQQCKAINQGAALSKLAHTLLGLPFSYGVLILYAKAVAKQYLRAAAIVAALGEGTPDTPMCGKASDFICDLLKDTLTNAPPGKPIGVFDDLMESATGDGPLDCPW
ncbi:MAG TPA: VWA domain-containing protein [Gemmatimonadaceae bacterium]|nr:VWA domain-containing protein [Gemmatimonadaceae bacterium]